MAKIVRLLSDLICAQDSVTHMNAQELEGAPETQQRINARNAISAEIIEYVELLERLVGVEL